MSKELPEHTFISDSKKIYITNHHRECIEQIFKEGCMVSRDKERALDILALNFPQHCSYIDKLRDHRNLIFDDIIGNNTELRERVKTLEGFIQKIEYENGNSPELVNNDSIAIYCKEAMKVTAL